MLVAVAPDKYALGVPGPGHDWRLPMGAPGNDAPILGDKGHVKAVGSKGDHVVMDLGLALSTQHKTDAHLVMYVLRDEHGSPVRTQPRVNKFGLPFVRGLGFSVALECFFADVDNVGHVPWTPELREQAAIQDARLATAGVYYTSRGRRIVQPLTRAVDVDIAEAVLDAWHQQLARLGILVDKSCKDWTRYYRLPHVRRAGKLYRSPVVELGRMAPIDPPAPIRLAVGRLALGRGARPTLQQLGPQGPLAEAPLARAFHAAGLLGATLSPHHAAVRCPFEAEHTSRWRPGDTSTVVFASSARYPLGYWHCSHAHCAGRSQRDVLAALPAEARALVQDRPAAEKRQAPGRATVSHAEAKCLLEEAIRRREGVLGVIASGCGVGKTEAAIAVAIERAKTPHATPGDHVRAPAHSRTALSVPTTALAIQVADRFAARGVQVRRLFGPLSARHVDGSPVCVYHEQASAYAAGGQSIPWDFCRGRDSDPCEALATCPAAAGEVGPRDARIVLGPHELLGRLTAEAGVTGLLVVDEPPELLVHEGITREHVESTIASLGHFDGRYSSALEPCLRALADWIDQGTIGQVVHLAEAVRAGAPTAGEALRVYGDLCAQAERATGHADPVEAARHAFEDGERHGSAPPVKTAIASVSRRTLAVARQVGPASRVLSVVWQALAATEKGGQRTVLGRLEERPDGRRVLVVTLPNEQLTEAMRREGPTHLLDASGRLHLPIYHQVIGYEPRLTEVYADDGAPVERVVIRARATRSAWAPGGQLRASRELAGAVRAAVDWIREAFSQAEQSYPTTPKVAIVTMRPVRLALEAALGRDVRAAWVEAGQDADDLPGLVATLGPELQRLLPVVPDVAHYGAIRGLDHWRDHDVLVTLGDPWRPVLEAQREAGYLQIEGWEGRYEDLAAAELEQAHGRLRTVHRSRPARALHVGRVLPAGWGQAEVRERAGGRPRVAPAMAAEDVAAAVAALGGMSAAERATGTPRAVLRRYATGERPCPPDVARVLSRHAGQACKGNGRPWMDPKPPCKVDLYKGVSDPGGEAQRTYNGIATPTTELPDDAA